MGKFLQPVYTVCKKNPPMAYEFSRSATRRAGWSNNDPRSIELSTFHQELQPPCTLVLLEETSDGMPSRTRKPSRSLWNTRASLSSYLQQRPRVERNRTSNSLSQRFAGCAEAGYRGVPSGWGLVLVAMFNFENERLKRQHDRRLLLHTYFTTKQLKKSNCCSK